MSVSRAHYTVPVSVNRGTDGVGGTATRALLTVKARRVPAFHKPA